MHPNMSQSSQIHEQTYIARTAEVCGGGVILYEQVSLWPQAILRADVQPITVGKQSNIQDQVMIHGTHDSKFQPGGFATTIGSHVTVGHKAMLHGAHVSDFCLIGMSSILLDGCQVDPWTMIGAGALVPPGKKLESGLWVGSPVRKVRELTDKEKEFIVYSAQHYWNLALTYREKEENGTN